MKISGDLGLMALPDLMQWAETNKMTGTLSITSQKITKLFYLQDGKIIFISSQKKGERLGEFFKLRGNVPPEKIEASLKESRRLGVPFTGYLISERIVDQEILKDILGILAETALSEALTWKDGAFEFTDSLPSVILNGPVMLNTSFVVFQAVKILDEARRDTGDPDEREDFIKQLSRRIAEGNIDIPPVPDIMHRFNQCMQQENISIHEIVKLIMSDQILTSKILKVVNSAFYSQSSEITSLQQAIIRMGLKSIFSIVSVHTLGGLSPGNAGEVRDILRHSLLCAFIAKKVATAVRIDPEEAFVCGLLHDIGKTVIISLLSGKTPPHGIRDILLKDYHEGVGFMLASKWNFSEVVRYSVRYHHSPGRADSHKKVVEAIYIADTIANGRDIVDSLAGDCSTINFDKITEILSDLDSIKETVNSII